MSDMEESKAPSAPQISEMIDKLLAEPELINMVATAIGKAPSEAESQKKEGENMADGGVKNSAVSNEALSGLVSSLAPAIAALGKPSQKQAAKKSDRRDCLLVALKPYLCRERCEAIDYMIKLGRISELMRNIGGEGGS
jgi:hypothetical protein